MPWSWPPVFVFRSTNEFVMNVTGTLSALHSAKYLSIHVWGTESYTLLKSIQAVLRLVCLVLEPWCTALSTRSWCNNPLTLFLMPF